MKLSLGTWAFSFGPWAGHPISFEDVVKRAAQAGYDGIEICGYPPHVTLESHATKSSRAELVTLLEDSGLDISGYSADMSDASPAARGNGPRYLDLLKRNIELCADLGSPMIRVDTVAAPGSLFRGQYDRAFHRVAATWAEGAEFAAKANVRLAWEFEPGYAFNKPGEVVRMHQEVRHPNFYILFDTAHAYMCSVIGARQDGPRDVLAGGVTEFLDKLQGRIGAIHVIDSDGTLHRDETSTHRPFGEGLIDFDKLVPRLLQIENVEWWTVDLSFWAGSWDLVEHSRGWVLERLAKHAASVGERAS